MSWQEHSDAIHTVVRRADALAYYRYAWAVQDIAAFGEQVFLLPDQSEAARRDAMRYFTSQFAPGNIVALAMASDTPGLDL